MLSRRLFLKSLAAGAASLLVPSVGVATESERHVWARYQGVVVTA